ncbi:hypothetical protein Tco_0999471 [Tanacetum coccineum]
MVPGKEDRVEKFIGGLPDNIQGNVIAAEPTRLQDAVRIANNLMDQKLKNGNGRNENPDENVRGAIHVARECTYQDFMKCQPLNFKETEGVVGLIRWFGKMEIVFHIRNGLKKSQVKYATCTLLDGALSWWNSHKRTIRTEAAFTISWREHMKQMTEVYYPRNEIQKMETEL